MLSAPFLVTRLFCLVLSSTLTLKAYATPLPRNDSDSSLTPVSAGLLALGLGLPFVLLAILKLVYLKYRRAHTIHHGHQSSPHRIQTMSQSSSVNVLSEKQNSPLVGLGLDTSSASAAFALSSGLVPVPTTRKLFGLRHLNRTILRAASVSARRNLQGYLVGFLGSPEWETHIKVRTDKVARRTSLAKSTYVLVSCSHTSVTNAISGRPGSLHPSTFSPRSTLSRHPSMSPNLSPYLTASGFASNSISSGSRARTINSSSLGSKGGTLTSSGRTRTSATNQGSLTGRSNVSADVSGSHSGSANVTGSGSQRSRRSHRRSASVSGPAAPRRMSGSATRGARSCGSHSNRQSQSSKYASASLNTHTRSLSLSFLEMNTPELGVLSSTTKQEDFARTTERALDSVSAAADAPAIPNPSGIRPGLVATAASAAENSIAPEFHSDRRSFLNRTPFPHVPSAKDISKSTINKSRSIEDCASVHPSSPPCVALPSPTPGLYSSASASRSLCAIVKNPSSSKAVQSFSSMPHIGSSEPRSNVVESERTGSPTDVSPYLTPYYFSPNLIPSPNSSSPLSLPSASLRPTVSPPPVLAAPTPASSECLSPDASSDTLLNIYSTICRGLGTGTLSSESDEESYTA